MSRTQLSFTAFAQTIACPPAGASSEVNEAVQLGGSSASGQPVGTLRERRFAACLTAWLARGSVDRFVLVQHTSKGPYAIRFGWRPNGPLRCESWGVESLHRIAA